MKSSSLCRTVCLLAGLLCLGGCGHYGPPLSPEHFAPQAVKALQVQPSVSGVRFDWHAPENDVRNKDLKSLDGYRIMRRQVQAGDDLADTKAEFEELAMVPDLHVAKLEQLKKEALEAGKPTRKVKVDPALSLFSYSDISVKPGGIYLYKIVPVNQGGVAGKTGKLIRVDFRGETSQVALLTPSEFGPGEESNF